MDVLLYVLVGWFALSGLCVVGLCVMARRLPILPDRDEHAAVATALLQPDAPLFTATDERLIAFADEWLTYVDALPCTEES